MHEQIKILPIWVWIIGFVVVVTIATHFLIRNRMFTIIIPLLTTLLICVILGFHYFEQFIDYHVIATIDHNGHPHDISRSGWWLLVDGWPFWLIPSFIISVLVSLMMWWFIPKGNPQYLKIIQQASRTQNNPDNPTPTTSNIIMKQLEINDLQQKLAVAEEKYALVKNEKPQKSVRVNKYVKEIRQLRANMATIEKEMSDLKTINQQLEADLERANILVDSLMSDKFSD